MTLFNPKLPVALSAILLASGLVVAEEQPGPDVIGSAYDKETGHFLYSEQHFCEGEHTECMVQYVDSAGLVFAKKYLDYRQNPLSPSLVMTDFRSGVELRVPPSQEDNLVVDAGFDNYVRSVWDSLDAGDSAKFPFLPVGFDKPLKMMALRSDPGDCKSVELCLKINLDSWILGMLVDPIELYYSRADRRLQQFSGVSNIKGENGETLSVDIHYQYGDQLPAATALMGQENPVFNF